MRDFESENPLKRQPSGAFMPFNGFIMIVSNELVTISRGWESIDANESLHAYN